MFRDVLKEIIRENNSNKSIAKEVYSFLSEQGCQIDDINYDSEYLAIYLDSGSNKIFDTINFLYCQNRDDFDSVMLDNDQKLKDYFKKY